MSRKYLSKSTFITGLQCPKALYLKKYKPELADEITLSKQNIFDVGSQVGILAQKLFPGGVDASPEHYSKLPESINYTKKLISRFINIQSIFPSSKWKLKLFNKFKVIRN